MKKIFTIIVFAIGINISANAQTNTFPSTGAAGIGTTTPDASSLLEIKSTKKGFLPPRMTLAQRNAISAPATGLFIYQTNSTPGFYYYSGSAWKVVTTKAGWSLTGNANTDSSINFIGTTDSHPLVFRVNNVKAGYIDYDYSKANTAFGYLSLNYNTTGSSNTALGSLSLYLNTTGHENSAIGSRALYANNGYANTAFGVQSMELNNNGSRNVAIGILALRSNNSGYDNTAVGYYAGVNNTTGSLNVAIGTQALYNSTVNSNLVAIGENALYNNGIGGSQSYDGTANTAIGSKSLYSNTIGYNNTACGLQSLYNNTSGYNNAAYGLQALKSNINGIGNTAIGVAADVNNSSWQNATAIGYFALSTGSNQVRLGNSDVTSIGGYANWTNISDGRVKKNIKANVPGLAFINKLNPVTYNLDLDAADKIVQRPAIKDKEGKTVQSFAEETAARKVKEGVIYTGFVAQDVEKAAKSLNYNFSGVDAAKNDKDLYGLRYAEFVVPLVKAVQELSKMNDDKDAKIDNLQKQIDELKAIIVANQSSAVSQQSTSISSASLQQNIPNPFNHSTTINYSLPSKFTSAQIIITDKSGQTLKAVNISGSKGNLTVDASTLAAGAYQYSLIIDKKLISTKQMAVLK